MNSTPTTVSGFAGFGARQLANRIMHATSPGISSISRTRCSGLGLSLASLIQGDASRAPGLYRGIFELGGCKTVLAGTSIFELPDIRPPSFDLALHSFGWLHDLHAANTQLYRVFARGLVSEWLALKTYRSKAARDPKTVASRVINWTQSAQFLLRGASTEFEAAFLESMTRQTRLLARNGVNHFQPAIRLDSAIAMVYATFGTTGLENLQKSALQRLSQELDQQILADGGHVSRNGETLVNLLLLLLPVRDVLQAAYIELPAPINAAMERMFPMLRFLSHSDHGLAVFNGVSRTSPGAIKAILGRDEVCGKPLNHAPMSGYSKLASGRTSILMDTGNPALPGHNIAAACSPLAFELCDGPHRIVVNCGNKPGADRNWLAASRLTSAHSTMTVGSLDTSIIIDNTLTRHLFSTPMLLGRGTVEAEVKTESLGGIISASHTCYTKVFGLVHQRRLFLNNDGADLRGEDSLVPEYTDAAVQQQTDFAIRFHLHPSVKANISRNGSSIMLVLPNKTGWQFCARGGLLSLEKSIYLPDSRSARPTDQIVISGASGKPDRVLWAFKRMKKVTRKTFEPDLIAPELPLNAG